MTRPVHAAYVYEFETGAFVGICAETFAGEYQWAAKSMLDDGPRDRAIDRALDWLSQEVCVDADHVHAAEIDAAPVNPDGHVSYRLTVKDDVIPLLDVAVGAERARIRKAQAGALRNLRVLFAPECDGEEYGEGCDRRHSPDCPRRHFGRELRALRAATKPVGR